ncbi:hypothetical protein ACFQ64_16080 [Streptomyces sp. NPDC056460]|uniref:hypothetical protein n=1 Tax=Streptomyces sp. NPDC056460 TaxID=3345825 RepID=UPI0036BC99EA
MHLRRTVLAAVVGITAPAAVLSAPVMAADDPPTRFSLPDRSPEGVQEKAGPNGRKKGVTVSVHGVPETFTAGGPWQELTLVVDAEPTDTDREVTLKVEDNETLQLTPEYTDVQIRGAGGWGDVNADRWSQGNPTAHYDLIVPAGETQLSVRIRFHRDAPLVHFYLAASDGINLDSPDYESQLVLPVDPGDRGTGEPTDPADPGTGEPTDPADPGTGEPTDPGTSTPTSPGNEAGAGDSAGSAGGGAEEPEPSTRPTAPGTHPAAGESAPPEDPASAPSGTLAETGSSPGAYGMIGAGGIAIALGTAAVHRFRRRPAA